MGEVTKYENLIGNNFNNYFANTTKTLKLKKHPNFDDESLRTIAEYF